MTAKALSNIERQNRFRARQKARLERLRALVGEFEDRAATFETVVQIGLATADGKPICLAEAHAYRECARLLTEALEDER